MGHSLSKPTFRRRWLSAILLGIYLFQACLPLTVWASDAPRIVRAGWFSLDGYQFIDKNGSRSGYGYEYYQEIARYTGWRYEYVPGTWQECIDRLADGRIDLLSFVQKTEERERWFDFSAVPIAHYHAVLTTLSSNTVYSPGNYAALNGIRVGSLRGAAQVQDLKAFAAENGFSYRLQEYGESSELLLALQSGAIDAILQDNFRMLSDAESVIAKFAPRTVYCAVRKGDAALLEDLENAMKQLSLDRPALEKDLMEKYYAANVRKSFSLTAEEKSFLEQLPVLRVVSSTPRAPLNLFQDGSYRGINADILAYVCSQLGIQYEFVPTASYRETLSLLQKGEADLACGFYTDYAWAEQNRVQLTSPYLSLQYSAVRRRGPLPENPNVAAVRGYRSSEIYVQANYPDERIAWYDSEEACIKAVSSGKQDLTFTSSYVAENILSTYRYSNLTATVTKFSHDLSFATSRDCPPMLNFLIDRALRSLSADDVSSIVARYTLLQKPQLGWYAFIYRNPLTSLSLLFLISAVILVLLAIMLRTKNRHRREMETLLHVDDVTGFPSQLCFIEETEKLLHTRAGTPYPLVFNDDLPEQPLQMHSHSRLAMLYMDIRKFKYINDTFGHSYGDRMLCTICASIEASLRPGEHFCRSYADHFAVLLRFRSEADLEKRIVALEDAICKAADKTFHYAVQLQTGIYLLHPNEKSAEKAIDRAHYAKDSIQDTFINTHAYYDDTMRLQVRMEKVLEQEMLPALEKREFEAYFQPRYDIAARRVIGAEALVRWNHPSKGLLFPGSFVPYFEKNGFIVRLDLYMFEETCKCLRELIDEGLEPGPISCNFSRKHLQDSTLPERLHEIAKAYGVPPFLIETELTETMAMEDLEQVVDFANRLKRYGFLISIDDFGSGYSSIQLLYRIPIDILKLDKVYIQSLNQRKIEDEVISCVIRVAHNNGILVVCEGVETEEQEQFLVRHNCNLAQGYLYAKPMRFAAFHELLQQQPPAPEAMGSEKFTGGIHV